jgi:hypothetical protein
VFVLQAFGDAGGLFGLDLFGGGAQRFVGFAALFRAARVGDGVGEGDPRFESSED